MSFECDKCHLKYFGDPRIHMFKSYGRCESCGVTDACSDCHCPPVKRIEPPHTSVFDLEKS